MSEEQEIITLAEGDYIFLENFTVEEFNRLHAKIEDDLDYKSPVGNETENLLKTQTGIVIRGGSYYFTPLSPEDMDKAPFRVWDFEDLIGHLPVLIKKTKSVDEIANEISEEVGPDTTEQLFQPRHYETLNGQNTMEFLACSMTPAEWRGFCLGNILTHRIRAGKKGSALEDIAKADSYEKYYDKYHHLTRKDDRTK